MIRSFALGIISIAFIPQAICHDLRNNVVPHYPKIFTEEEKLKAQEELEKAKNAYWQELDKFRSLPAPPSFTSRDPHHDFIFTRPSVLRTQALYEEALRHFQNI
jgi:hypothetical protein